MSVTVMYEGEIAAARSFLKDCADAYARPWDDVEETEEFIDAMTGDELRAMIRRTWGEWQEWRTAYADAIAEEAAIEQVQWWAEFWAEFDAVARWRLYGSHMRQAQAWTSCTATGAEAAREIGERVIESRHHESWAEIAQRLGAPTHVVVVWSVETRIRKAAAALARPFRTAL